MTGLIVVGIILVCLGGFAARELLRLRRDHLRISRLPVLSEKDCRRHCYQARPGRPMVRRIQHDGRPRRWRRRLTVLDVLVPARQQPAATEEHSVDQDDSTE